MEQGRPKPRILLDCTPLVSGLLLLVLLVRDVLVEVSSQPPLLRRWGALTNSAAHAQARGLWVRALAREDLCDMSGHAARRSAGCEKHAHSKCCGVHKGWALCPNRVTREGATFSRLVKHIPVPSDRTHVLSYAGWSVPSFSSHEFCVGTRGFSEDVTQSQQ